MNNHKITERLETIKTRIAYLSNRQDELEGELSSVGYEWGKLEREKQELLINKFWNDNPGQKLKDGDRLLITEKSRKYIHRLLASNGDNREVNGDIVGFWGVWYEKKFKRTPIVVREINWGRIFDISLAVAREMHQAYLDSQK